MKPYVGITGPVMKNEVTALCTEFYNAGFNMSSRHIPMLGFLVSQKTLNYVSIDNLRYPWFGELPYLLEETNGSVLTMIHYNSREKATLSSQVEKIFNQIYNNSLCRALQLNIVWPDVNEVKKIKDKFPEMILVFQASHNAVLGKAESEVADKIALYGKNIDYVLIDPSGGRGLEFDLNHSLSLYNKLKKSVSYLTMGFAGGFTGENVRKRIDSLTVSIGNDNFCIDAESGLRDKLGDEYGDDLLNFEKAKNYIIESGALR